MPTNLIANNRHPDTHTCRGDEHGVCEYHNTGMHQPCFGAAEESQDDSAQREEDDPSNTSEDPVGLSNNIIVRCLSHCAMGCGYQLFCSRSLLMEEVPKAKTAISASLRGKFSILAVCMELELESGESRKHKIIE
jgi:hypothetical protein